MEVLLRYYFVDLRGGLKVLHVCVCVCVLESTKRPFDGGAAWRSVADCESAARGALTPTRK